MEYENCKAYRIKMPDGICCGNDNEYDEYEEKCNDCPAYIRYTEARQKEKMNGGDASGSSAMQGLRGKTV